MSTLAGYLWSLRLGLFGFREVRTTAGLVTGTIEIVGFVALAGSRCDRTETSSSIAVAVSLPDRESTSAVARGQMGNRSTGVLAAPSLATSLSNADAASALPERRT